MTEIGLNIDVIIDYTAKCAFQSTKEMGINPLERIYDL